MSRVRLFRFAPSPAWPLALVGALSLAPGDAFASPAACDPLSLFGPPRTIATGPSPLYIVSRDFNQDGTLDLAVTNSDYQNGGYNNSVAILLGTGGLNYAAPVHYPVQLNPHMLAPGDFNEDGIVDLVAANKWSNTVSVLIGQGSGGVGNGTFAPAVHYPTGGYPFQIVVEDFDRDGIVDLAVSLNSVAAVALLRGGGSAGVGDGTFGPPSTLALNYLSTGLEGADFDLDGITDLVATENAVGTIAFLRGTGIAVLGSTSFAPAVHIPAGPLPFEFAVGDFNEDGKPDLAVAQQTTSGGTAVMLGNGNGTFQTPTFLPTDNTVVVTPDDVNQDGITDLLIGTITGWDTGNVRVYLGQGSGGVGNGAFGSPSSYGPIGDTYQILAGDFDGDGRRDLAVSYYLRTTIAVLPGTCSGTPPPPPVDPRLPVLTDVRDVPNDQGGRVFLTWTRSSLDVIGGAVNAYRIWRRIPPLLAGDLLASAPQRADLFARPADGSAFAAIEYWEALATLPAQRLQGYGYTAPTTQDSISGSNPHTAFFVSALTADIDVFYSSNVDSGYSVDNLAPPAPQPFVARYDYQDVALHWGISGAADFSHFKLYRGTSAGFTPGPGTLILATIDTGFVDTSPAAPIRHYKLSAVDVHGNESGFAAVSPPMPTPVLVSLVDVAAEPGRVRIRWSVGEAGLPATVYRRTRDSGWAPLQAVHADGTGRLAVEDTDVAPSRSYGYRLGLVEADVEVFAGEVWIETPAIAGLALRPPVPNPGDGRRFIVEFALADAGPARIELLDVAGRIVLIREVGALGAGDHRLELAGHGPMPAGLYFLRLTQAGASRMVRTAIVR